MSKHDKISKLKEYIKNFVIKELEKDEEIDEASTTASAGAANPMGTGIYYDTPKAFSSGSAVGHKSPEVGGYKKVKESFTPYKDVGKKTQIAGGIVNHWTRILFKELPVKHRNVNGVKKALRVIQQMYMITDHSGVTGMYRVGKRKFMKDVVKKMDKLKESVNESQPFADFTQFPKLSRAQQESLDELFGFAESYQIYNAFEKDPKKFIKTLDDMANIRKASNKKPKGVNFNKGKKQFVKEGRYHDWRNDESMTPKQKIGRSMREIRDALNELDKTVKMNLKLKTELKMKSEDYWKNTHKALTKISERLVKMANKVGNLK